MIVVDSSAIIALVEWEAEGDLFLSLLLNASRVAISTVTFMECSMVSFGRHREKGVKKLHQIVNDIKIEVVPFDCVQLQIAIDAFQRYGKGINPRSRLNFGDCARYALAKQLDAPLLFKGNDFAETDVKRCA